MAAVGTCWVRDNAVGPPIARRERAARAAGAAADADAAAHMGGIVRDRVSQTSRRIVRSARLCLKDTPGHCASTFVFVQ